MSDSSSAPESSSRPTSSAETPVGFSRIARRWAQWASNLFVSGIVIVMGLVFGREVIEWWHAGRPSDSGAVAGSGTPAAVGSMVLPLPADDSLHHLAFGESSLAIRHGELVGDEVAVLTLLRRECEAAAGEADPERTDVSDAERRMIAGLGRLAPVSRQGLQWEQYELPRPLPMVAVVSGTSETVAAQRRVLSWGMALPYVSDDERSRWSWFAWCPSKPRADRTNADVEWPHWPDGRRMMTLRSADGAAVAAYVGRGDSLTWRQQFDQWMSQRGAVPRDDWSRQNEVHHRSFEQSDGKRYVIQIAAEPSGELRGIVTVIPRGVRSNDR